MGFDPNEKLGKLQARFKHSVTQSKHHLICIEDVERVFALKVGSDGIDPINAELFVFSITLDMVIGNYLIFSESLKVPALYQLGDQLRAVNTTR